MTNTEYLKGYYEAIKKEVDANGQAVVGRYLIKKVEAGYETFGEVKETLAEAFKLVIDKAVEMKPKSTPKSRLKRLLRRLDPKRKGKSIPIEEVQKFADVNCVQERYRECCK